MGNRKQKIIIACSYGTRQFIDLVRKERRCIMEVIKQKELWEEQLQTCLSKLDVEYSYQLAKRMEKEKTNPVLGYRTAGSKAKLPQVICYMRK